MKRAMLAIGLMLTPVVAIAQDAPPPAAALETPAPIQPGAPAADAAVAPPPATPAAPPHLAPQPGVGQPVDRGLALQDQVTPIGRQALWIHNAVLMPIITVITLFVLALLVWVVARYRRAANPEPSKTSHNTVIEIIWTVLPVLILIGIALPSLGLLAAQYRPASADALTIKAVGNQWYWTYEYPDNGGFEIISNMLPDAEAARRGEPRLLAVDNRVVVPVGREIKLQVTSNDVIHSWAMPAFWAKMDAVPGRLNEITFTVERAGVYYGQCSELCGARHAYMPIAVEAVPAAQFEAWVLSRGGTMLSPDEVSAAENAAAAAATPAPAEDGAMPMPEGDALTNAVATPETVNQAATDNTGN